MTTIAILTLLLIKKKKRSLILKIKLKYLKKMSISQHSPFIPKNNLQILLFPLNQLIKAKILKIMPKNKLKMNIKILKSMYNKNNNLLL